MPITAETIPGARIYEKRTAPLPVRVAIARHAFANGLQGKTAERILSVVSRESLEGVSHRGKSWLVPLAPAERFADGQNIRIKSATDRGGPPVMAAYEPSPDNGPIVWPEPRLMVDASDKIQVEPMLPHPTGTGFLYQAVNEYLTMTEAHDRNVPTHYPLGVGQFLDFSFGGEEVGFVIILINNQGTDRIGLEIYRMLELAKDESLGKPAQAAKFREAFEKLRRDSYAATRTLRLLHENGLTHSRSDLYNYDPVAEKQAPLCDFAHAKSYREMNRGEFMVRVFNDIQRLYRIMYGHALQARFPLSDIRMIFKRLNISAPFDEPFRAMARGKFSTSGYFCETDIKGLNWKKIQDAMKMESFLPFIEEYWQEDRLPGSLFSSLPHSSVRLIANHAGSIYDRLKAAE